MDSAYKANLLPLSLDVINPSVFMDELIDATAKFEVYKEKIKDSKLDSIWFMPTLQQREALASSTMEGTQASLDGVLTNQVLPNDKDKNINEVRNYYFATALGYKMLSKHDFSDEFFFNIHQTLMLGNVRKPDKVGEYRTTQNFIGKNDPSHAISFIPPVPEDIPELMNNIIEYMNNPGDKFRPLIRTAIIHAQFETIHPFLDGNGRVGRMLIPMYLYSQKQIDFPYFFISEALERDKFLYYNLLNNIRYKGEWNEWIRFFLSSVINQCETYIEIVSKINALYEKHLDIAKQAVHASNIVDVINALYTYPISTKKQIAETTHIPLSSVSRYLNALADCKIISSDNKRRNRTYYYYELLDILR